MRKLSIFIFGKSGKMGRAVTACAGEIHIASTPESADILIDFSIAETLSKHLTIASEHSKPIVIGTTGHSEENLNLMKRYALNLPIFYAPNFSKGIFLLKKCVENNINIIND